MCHLIIGQVGVKFITSVTGARNQTHCREYASTKIKVLVLQTNKLDKLSNFAVNTNHAIEEQSQSRSCFESKDGERISFA